MFDEELRDAVASRLRLGGPVPGFGHPLYPNGYPRGARLLEIARAFRRDVARGLEAAGRELLEEAPNLDLGLVALARALRLPREAPLARFAIGRTAGWIAHAMEEYASGRLIRPRARMYSVPEQHAQVGS